MLGRSMVRIPKQRNKTKPAGNTPKGQSGRRRVKEFSKEPGETQPWLCSGKAGPGRILLAAHLKVLGRSRGRPGNGPLAEAVVTTDERSRGQGHGQAQGDELLTTPGVQRKVLRGFPCFTQATFLHPAPAERRQSHKRWPSPAPGPRCEEAPGSPFTQRAPGALGNLVTELPACTGPGRVMRSSKGSPGHGENPSTKQVLAVKGRPAPGGRAPNPQPRGYQTPPPSHLASASRCCPSRCVFGRCS